MQVDIPVFLDPLESLQIVVELERRVQTTLEQQLPPAQVDQLGL